MKNTSILSLTLLLAAATASAQPADRMRSVTLDNFNSSGTMEFARSQSASGRIMLTPDTRTNQTAQAPVFRGIPARKAALKSLSGASFNGWLDPNENEDGGWYTLDSDGNYKKIWTNQMSQIGIQLLNGWIKGDRLCGLGSFTIGATVAYYNYLELDLANGEILKEESIAGQYIDDSTYYITSAYVPSEDRVYGYTYTLSDEGIHNGFRFASSPATNISDVKEIKNLTDYFERTSSLCYREEDNMFYGVNMHGDFVKIDRQGNETVVFNLGLPDIKSDPSALIWSPLDGCFLYCAYYYNYATQLLCIYPDEQKVEFVRNFPSSYQFTFLLDTDVNYIAEAPARPVQKSIDMTPGSTSSTIVYTLPSALGNGSALSGQLNWTLYVDDESYKTGTANAGSDVTVTLDDLTEGLHVIRFSASNAAGEGLPCVMRKYFGNGIPSTPQNVTLTEKSLSWDPVTTALFDGYLDTQSVEYNVYINDRMIARTSTTSCVPIFDEEKTQTAYRAYVEAVCHDKISDKGVSNKVIYGKPFPLPYTMTPTQQEFDLCHVYNVDGSPDYGVWDFSQSRWHEPVLYSGWNLTQADDWIILPAVDCSDISHAFRLTLDACCGGSANHTESFEVWCGDAPTVEAMTTQIMSKTSVQQFITKGWLTFSNLFVPKSPGPCYIGIRAVSDPEQYSLIIRQIKIEATDEVTDVPVAPEDLTLVSKSDADLTATYSFRLPAKTIAGNDIAADADLKGVLRTGANTAEVAGTPGQTVTVTVRTAQGNNRIEALASLNGQLGQAANVSLFTGTIPPNYVENFKGTVSEDNLSVTLTWSEPTQGQENLEGYYSPDGMTYWLYGVEVDDYGEAGLVPIKDLGNVHEHTVSVKSSASLGYVYLGIVAANKGGMSAALSYVHREVGKPYSKIDENFRGGQTHYSPFRNATVNSEYSNSAMELLRPEIVSDDAWSSRIPYALGMYTENENGGRGRLVVPKVKTQDMTDPVVEITLWTGAKAAPVDVYAVTYANQFAPEKILEMPVNGDGWKTYSVALPEKYTDRPWMQIMLDAEFESNAVIALIGAIRIVPAEDSGIISVDSANRTILGGTGVLTVRGLPGDNVNVWTIDGRKAASASLTGNGEINIPLARGIYVAACGDMKAKVIIR